jgi:hypothetical protein
VKDVRRPISPRTAVGLLLTVGAVLVASTFFVGWYEVSVTNGSQSVSETFDLSGVHEASSGMGSSSGSYASSYAGAHLPGTGWLFVLVDALLVGAILVGLAGGLLVLLGGRRVSAKEVLMIALLATVLCAVAPAVLLAAQPPAVCGDAQHFPPPLSRALSGSASQSTCTWEFYLGGGTWSNPVGVAGPGATFAGQATQSGSVQTWGPGIGWIVAAFAAGTTLAAVPMALLYTRTADAQHLSGRKPSSESHLVGLPPPSRSP